MKKVLIVDDELLVQVGLKSIINWEEFGLTVVGEAKNGQEAMEIFDKINPDIVFVDIAMPVMNGFDLIKALKVKNPSVKTCILTNHMDFDYLKEAAKLDVCEYLLKSELTRDNLAKCIDKMLKHDEKENAAENSLSAPSENHYFNSANLAEEDLFKIITGFFKSEEDISNIEHKYRFHFNNSVWFISVAQIIIDSLNFERYKKDLNHFRKVILDLSRQVFSENNFAVHTSMIEDKLVLIFSINNNEDIAAVKDKIIKLLDLLKNNLKHFLNIELYVGLSGYTDSFFKLPELYKQAYMAKEECFFDSMRIAVYDETSQEPCGSTLRINLRELEKLLLKGDKEAMEKYLDEIFDDLYKYKNKEYAKNTFIDLLSQAKLFAETLLEDSNLSSLAELSFDYNVFNQLNNFKAVKDYIINIYNKIIEIRKNEYKTQYSYAIRKSIDYIKKNYQRNISLSDVADHVGVSKNYLSFLFKQEKKTNFSTFLLNYRIEKAKELLVKENAKIYEIANMVGFENPYYFSKVFRDVVGMSCKEYQKLYYKSV